MDNGTESMVVRWSRQYANENEEQIRRQRATAQDILQENYWGVYDFFCDVLEYEVDYKILRARRCQVLFLIFLPIILLEEGDSLNITGEFISDNSLVKYMNQREKKPAVIIDDIVIHGRGLEEVYKFMDSDFKNDGIKVLVYAKSRKATLRNELAVNLEFRIEAFEQEWRRLSTQFVNLIYACASPYISYVESTYENNAVFQEKEVAENFLILENTNHYQELQKEMSRVLFEKGTVPSIFCGLGYDCCLRVYTSDALQKMTFIPYVFIKNTEFNQISSVIKEVRDRLPEEKAENIINDLKKFGNERQSHAISYKMKLFSTLINHIYGLYLKEKYHILLQNSKLDIVMLAVCYGEEIARDFSRLEYQDVSDILELTVAGDIEAEVEEDSELNEILENVRSSNNSSSKEKCRELQEYFYENNQIDERLAKEGKARKQGLSLGAFYRAVDVEDIHWISLAQLNAWDSGIASCNIIYKENETVSSYVASGEQSFRYVLERHKVLFQKMIYAYNSPLWTKTEETGAELADKVYQKYLADTFPREMKETREKEILESFMEENKDKLKDWGIPEIFA